MFQVELAAIDITRVEFVTDNAYLIMVTISHSITLPSRMIEAEVKHVLFTLLIATELFHVSHQLLSLNFVRWPVGPHNWLAT